MSESERTNFIPKWARNMTPEQIAALDSDDFQIGPPPEPERKTVTVRIPVFVFSDGTGWFTSGSSSVLSDATALDYLSGDLADSDFCGKSGFIEWREFEVPIPEPVEVQGKVE